METWVLVLMLSGTGVSTVPGYETKKGCRIAGMAFVGEDSSWRNSRSFECIPGPKEPKIDFTILPE
jgi:hypothetical protein